MAIVTGWIYISTDWIRAVCAWRLSELLLWVRWSWPSHSWWSARSVIHNSCLLTDFKFGMVERATKFLGSDVKVEWDEVACCRKTGGQGNAILTGPLYSQCIFAAAKLQWWNNKVLTIALRYTEDICFLDGWLIYGWLIYTFSQFSSIVFVVSMSSTYSVKTI